MLPNSQPSKRKWLQPPDSLISKVSKTSRDSSPPGPRTPAGTSTPGAGAAMRANQTPPSSRVESPASEQQNQSLVHPQSETSAGPTTGAPPKSKKSAVTALEAALRGLRISTKLVPPLHSAVDTLASCLGAFESTTKYRKEYEDMALELEEIVTFLAMHMKDPRSQRMSDVVISISETLEKDVNRISKRQDCNGLGRLAEALRDEENLVKDYRRIKGLFLRLQFEVGMSQWSIEYEHILNTRLEGLSPVKLATYDSILDMQIGRTTCTENTRTAILSHLYDWSDDPNGKKVYWTNGMAGTGKTTIACTLATTLASRGQLGASFFCTRTEASCRDATRIVPTIAYQLARFSTPFQAELCQALVKDPDIGSRNIEKQFEGLLQAPLSKSKDRLPSNLVVVIDALDECNDSSAVELVLGLCVRFASGLPIKFFVSSRPEPKIYETMSQNRGVRDVLILHEIKKSLVQEDIEVYLRDKLAFMSPPIDKIKRLADIAGNLFIYAATAVRYIRPPKSTVNHKKRLETILAVNPRSTSTKQLAGIDVLYSAVLEDAIEDEELETDEAEVMKMVLWTALCAREPVLIETIACLLGLDQEEVLTAIQPLRSVLFVSESSALVSTLHASFPDFMFNQQRSGRFFCNVTRLSTLLTQHCFEVMQEQLRFNICDLESSFVPDSQVPDLRKRIARNISPALSYACRNWGGHLQLAEASDQLCKMLNTFLSHQLLFWMEVLNLKQCMEVGRNSLLWAQQWIDAKSSVPDLTRFIGDAHHFVATFLASSIGNSTPHIYISALPLCPPSSYVFQHYQQQTKGLIAVRGTALMQTHPATWMPGTDIMHAAFSLDGTKIVFCDSNSTIYMRDTHSGKNLAGPIKRNHDVICSMALSPASTHIACGFFDTAICVWRLQNGGGELVAGPFKGHTERSWSINFSADGARIVSASTDLTICVWDVHNGSLTAGPFKSQHWVSSVLFSPNGEHIVSGSMNGLAIRNAQDGRLLISTSNEPAAGICCMAFSPDGNHIVSGSIHHSISIWSVLHGTVVTNMSSGHKGQVNSVTFSPNSTLVASCDDFTICVWNVADGALVAGPFGGHTDRVWLVTFTPDAKHIISCSWDGAIRVWALQVDPLSNMHTAFAMPWTTRKDGWIVNACSELLFGVPADLLCRFPTVQNLCVHHASGSSMVDYRNVLIGDQWHKCFIGL